MSDHLLFLVGVVGSDDDRPRQHRPAPVRCLEHELAPFRDTRPRCTDCGIMFPSESRTVCHVCERERALRSRQRNRRHGVSAEQRIEDRIASDGHVVATRNNMHVIERLLQQRRVRWLSESERTERGLQRFGAVVVLRMQP